MPVAQGPKFDPVRAIILGAVGVALGVALIFLVARLAGSGSVEVKLGDDRFEDIDASELADEIAARGPVLFPDAGVGSRDIIIQHLGSTPEDGWLAFDARLPGRPRECFLRWVEEDRLFVDVCDETVTVAADGGDLTQYPVEVTDDRLVVDINAADREAEELEEPAP